MNGLATQSTTHCGNIDVWSGETSTLYNFRLKEYNYEIVKGEINYIEYTPSKCMANYRVDSLLSFAFFFIVVGGEQNILLVWIHDGITCDSHKKVVCVHHTLIHSLVALQGSGSHRPLKSDCVCDPKNWVLMSKIYNVCILREGKVSASRQKKISDEVLRKYFKIQEFDE